MFKHNSLFALSLTFPCFYPGPDAPEPHRKVMMALKVEWKRVDSAIDLRITQNAWTEVLPKLHLHILIKSLGDIRLCYQCVAELCLMHSHIFRYTYERPFENYLELSCISLVHFNT